MPSPTLVAILEGSDINDPKQFENNTGSKFNMCSCKIFDDSFDVASTIHAYNNPLYTNFSQDTSFSAPSTSMASHKWISAKAARMTFIHAIAWSSFVR